MYAKLDQDIVTTLRASTTHIKFADLAASLRDELSRIAKENNREEFRVLDGRMQALRRKGVITFSDGGWAAAGK